MVNSQFMLTAHLLHIIVEESFYNGSVSISEMNSSGEKPIEYQDRGFC
jgi:hypothetical protein